MGRLRHLVAGTIGLLLAACLSCAVYAASLSSTPPETVSACTERLTARLTDVSTREAFWDAAGLCQTLAAADRVLAEQLVREDNYVFQRGENVVLMWMVVSITLAGVLLAAGQLYAAFHLATRNRADASAREVPQLLTTGAAVGPATLEGSAGGMLTTEEAAFSTGASTVTITKDSLAVQSSVVGVVVLAISFAFFLVFVLYVYTFQEPKNDLSNAPATSVTSFPHQVSTQPASFPPASDAVEHEK